MEKLITNILAETIENTIDNTIENVASTVLIEAIKGFPVVNAVKGTIDNYQSYQQAKRANQFLQFIQECEYHEAGRILKIFSTHSNTEMGKEVLKALESSYIELHSQMIARITILYDSKALTRIKFLRYTHTIPKLSSFLLTQIQVAYRFHLERKNNEDYRIFNRELEGAGEELTSYGFFKSVPTAGSGDFYQGNDELEYFHEHIMKNKYDKTD
ncbi:hypothetical protein [Acinetobacter junii]|uniref:hypothetical protein n=1 Tax=Acinetobacter junii TaxID=40215 RepID=UPI00301AC233